MDMSENIGRHLAELVAFRRGLHAHPELKYEHRTSDRVAQALRALGLEVHRGLATTGVVGTLRGKEPRAGDPSRAILLRADMDALPVQEANTFEHASTQPGRMHACGHDGHTAMLLGAARVLAENPDFDGTVHFVFQPAEEGGAGALKMIEEGLFERFPVEAAFALHNWPALPAGEFGVRVGPIMAAANRFEIRVNGRGAFFAATRVSIQYQWPAPSSASCNCWCRAAPTHRQRGAHRRCDRSGHHREHHSRARGDQGHLPHAAARNTGQAGRGHRANRHACGSAHGQRRGHHQERLSPRSTIRWRPASWPM